MKREVQALINRRRARLAPFVFLGLVGLVCLAGILLVVNFFTSGPGQSLLRTPTPTPTSTFTPAPATPTLAPTDAPLFTDTPTFTPGPSPTPTPITYTVKEGDTLFGIAVQFQVDIQALKLTNNLTGDTLSVGTILTIPAGDFQTPTPTPLPTGLPRGARIQYTVLLGDTLETIAAQFNSTVEDISRNNDNLTNAKLLAGQVIVVRVNLVTPTPLPTSTFTPLPPPPTATP